MVIKAHLESAALSPEDRRHHRLELLLETSGTLPDGLEANVIIHNISASGLLIETELPLDEGDALAIALPEAGPVDARIVWVSEDLIGCAFEQEIDESVLAAAQAQVGPFAQATAQPVLGQLTEPFGVRLNRLRRERSLTLAQIADALDVSKPTVWAWEKGKAKPLPERLEAIAMALGVSAAELGDARPSDEAQAVVQECRVRIATAYGTQPENIRIMIEV